MTTMTNRTPEITLLTATFIFTIISLLFPFSCAAFSPSGWYHEKQPRRTSSTIIATETRIIHNHDVFQTCTETTLRAASSQYPQPDAPATLQEDRDLQWELYTRHQAVIDGEWWGNWMTYNYMGDMIDSSIVGVSLQPNSDSTTITHTHHILTSTTQSNGCPTCFSSSEVTTLPTIATYTPNTLAKRHRCASVGMVVGPTILKSSSSAGGSGGILCTELVLRHGDGRVRVTFQHAPVWEKNVEVGSCPPQGLKLFRAIVSKEKLRMRERITSDAVTSKENKEENEGANGMMMILGPPSAEEEQKSPPSPGNPRFFRPVPPYQWHAKWAGTSWTWGPQTGDRGWSILEMDEADSWHGRPRGDAASVWSLVLPGGVLIQCPRVIVGGMAGLCRLAWMPEDAGEVGTNDGDGTAATSTAKLLRVEASVSALEPILSEEDENMMVGFYPPALGSLRTDILEKIGDLEGASLDERAKAAEGYVWGVDDDENSVGNTISSIAISDKSTKQAGNSSTASSQNDQISAEKIIADPRNALNF